MGVKIYADTSTGFLHFDGSRISPKPLNGVITASASNKAFRIRITRSDLLQANGNPRVMFKHLKMNRVERQDGTNLRLDLGYSRQQIIDYINTEAQKVVETGIEGVAVCIDGTVVSYAATTIDFTGSAVQSLEVTGGIATISIAQTTAVGGGSSYADSDVDTHLNVGLANTGDILTWGGSDYEWSAPSTIGAGNPVVNGSITGVGNSTLRLVLQDSNVIDIDLSTLNTTGSDDDINTRITKAVSFARTETTYLRYSVGSASNNMWDAAFRTPGSTPLGMGSAADTHVSNDGNAQPFAQTLIFRNAGINTDRDSVLVGVTDGDEADIMVPGIIHHYIGISSTKKLVHHWGEPHVLGIGTTQANRAELMDVSDDKFYGIFMDFDGQRFGTGVSTSQLNSQFRYKVVDLSSGDVTDLTPNWTHYGKSQDGNGDSRVYSRLMYGALAGTNNNNVSSASNVHLRFEGDIAQATSITYQQGAVLLDDTQVSLMVRNPEKYLRDYKVGTSSRRPYFDTTQLFKVSFANYHFQAAQVWLMGDGDYDSLGSSSEQGVRNFVRPDAYMRLNWPSYPSYTGFTTVSVTAGPSFTNTKSTNFENLDHATRNRQSGEFTNLIKTSGQTASAYTLSFWFRPGNNSHEDQNIFNAFSQYNTFEGTSIIQVMYNGNTASTRNIRFKVQDQSGGLDADNYRLDLATPVGDVTHTNGSNGFHHIAITCDGSANAYTSASLGIKIYINGVLQTLTDNSNGGGIEDVPSGGETFSIAPNKIALGRQPTNARYMRDSKVDELSFFNTELNATEVACLYNGGTPSNLANFIPGPAHWYRMGDGDSAPTLADSIGNADLSMTNMSDANFVTIVPS
ncbi:putative carbohydrate-binding module [Synechococcus phage S-B05]|nr:putative carbohydrate-binding module [Synechococcus phage S-B05]